MMDISGAVRASALDSVRERARPAVGHWLPKPEDAVELGNRQSCLHRLSAGGES